MYTNFNLPNLEIALNNFEIAHIQYSCTFSVKFKDRDGKTSKIFSQGESSANYACVCPK